MRRFDWHSEPITRKTPVTASYKNTQNVRRFLTRECGKDFKFDRPFMQWIKDGADKTMGDVADEWMRRHGGTPKCHGGTPKCHGGTPKCHGGTPK